MLMKSIDWSPVVHIVTIITSPTSIQTTKEKNQIVCYAAPFLFDNKYGQARRQDELISLTCRQGHNNENPSKSFWKDLRTKQISVPTFKLETPPTMLSKSRGSLFWILSKKQFRMFFSKKLHCNDFIYKFSNVY